MRKYFAVNEGAAVLTNKEINIKSKVIHKKVNSFYQSKIIAAIMKNYNFNDSDYLKYFEEGERIINSFHDLELCSGFGHKLFNSINHEEIKKRRINNSEYVYERGTKMGLEFLLNKIDLDTIPLCLPILIDDRDFIKKELHKKNIFLPVHWPILRDVNNDIDYIVKKELSLIIDQRYNIENMKFMMDCLESLL